MSSDGWFTTFPYIALGLFAVGLLVRRCLVRRAPGPEGAEEQVGWRSVAWRWGIGGVLAGHLLGLLVPEGLLAWNQHPVRLLVLEATGLALACLAIYGFAQELLRYRRPSTDGQRLSISGSVLVTALGAVLLSGIAIAILHRWGSSWYAATLVPYLMSLVRLAPDAGGVVEMPTLVRLHVLGAFLLIAVVPFLGLEAFLRRRLAQRR